MRIFTLGRNGIPLFLFALILFSGTFSTYGQATCPSVADSTQIFCDSEEAEVSDLQVTGDDVVWYADADLETALQATHLLENNVTYYASNSDASCAAVAVSVEINLMPEILGVKEGSQVQAQAQRQSLSTIGLCVADVENPEVFVGDLRTNVEAPDQVQWYYGDSEATAVPVGLDEELQNGTYWVERIVDTEDGETCTTNRRRTIVVLSSEAAPEGPAAQTFCAIDTPTLADIDASGNNRYFASATSETRLSENTALVDGTTYYVSTFGELCESFDRLAVTVTVTPVNFTETAQSFCMNQSESNNLGLATVSHLSPAGGTWYADENFEQLLAPDTPLADNTTYYLAPENCESTSVLVTLDEAPNAGQTSTAFFCVNDGPNSDLHGQITNPEHFEEIGREVDRGTINHSAFEGLIFDPAVLGVGTHVLRHTVTAPEGSLCESDSSQITVVVYDAPEAGSDITETLCTAQFSDLEALQAEFAGYLAGRDLNGTFDDNMTSGVETLSAEEMALMLLGQYNSPLERTTFSLTYSVANDNCEDSAQININIVESPDAGDGGNIQLVKDTTNDITLDDANEGTPTTGGTWTDANGTVVGGDFTPQEPGAYTYTVETNGCEATATVTVLAAPQDCPVVTETAQEFCETVGEGNEGGHVSVAWLQPTTATWYATADSQEALDPETHLVDGASYFAGSASGDCTTRTEVVVTVIDSPSAGKTSNVTVCSNDAPFDLVSKMAPSDIGPADPGGTFSPALASGTTIFDPAVDTARRYTYTVGSNTSCESDSAVIDVYINEAPNAGADISEDFCVNAETEIPSAEDFLAAYADDERDQNGTFEPTLEELAADFEANPFGTFTTVYSVSNDNCTDTATLSVTVTEEVPANAGGNVEETVCSTAGVQNLTDFLGEGAIAGGSFSAPYEDGTFDPSSAEGEVSITYTINGEIACVEGEDSATITLTVTPGPDAGENGTLTIAVTAEPVNLFDSLGGTPEEGGTWAPGNENGDLDPSEFVAGTYTFTYTVGSENECVDTADVIVTITGEVTCPEITQTEQSFCESIGSGNDFRLPTVTDLVPTGATWYASADATEALPANTLLVNGSVYFAGNSNGTCEERQSVSVIIDDSPNAGATSNETFCENQEPVDLLDYMQESILGPADLGGTFSPALASGGTIFDPAVDAPGRYTYRVESTNDACPADTAVIDITITPAASAGEGFTLNFCTSDEPQDLFTLLPEGVSPDGTFEGIEDGIFDPAVDAPGEFTYTVTQTGDCEGTSSATVTINVSEAPAAPVAEAQSFCASEGATVADLTAEGDVLTWYTDEALTTPAVETDALVAGTYYVTTTSEGGCESAAAAVEVSLTDAATPTLVQGGNVFCEFDNPTVAELEANVDADGTITWYDAATGGNEVLTSELLENGVVYYAASTDATSACESSVRLAVTVTLEECEAIIPDAFSPNNDSVNDRFVVDNLREQYPNFTIEIYNRWGNIVFKGNASTPDWDGVSTESGSLGDSVLPVGVYFYIVNFNDGQTAPTQGRLYLSR